MPQISHNFWIKHLRLKNKRQVLVYIAISQVWGNHHESIGKSTLVTINDHFLIR